MNFWLVKNFSKKYHNTNLLNTKVNKFFSFFYVGWPDDGRLCEPDQYSFIYECDFWCCHCGIFRASRYYWGFSLKILEWNGFRWKSERKSTEWFSFEGNDSITIANPTENQQRIWNAIIVRYFDTFHSVANHKSDKNETISFNACLTKVFACRVKQSSFV